MVFVYRFAVSVALSFLGLSVDAGRSLPTEVCTEDVSGAFIQDWYLLNVFLDPP